jgi:hypothetical protein
MLTITSRCEHPRCAGTVWFAPPRGAVPPRRRLGTCDRCGRTYSLYGGQITTVRPTPGPVSGRRQAASRRAG